jgi:hypothetical protein
MERAMVKDTQGADSTAAFTSPHTPERATKLAKALRDFVRDVFALRISLQACQDAIAAGAGRSSFNDFQKHAAKGGSVSPWNGERAIERLARRVPAGVANAALSGLMAQPWAAGDRLACDMRIITGSYGAAADLASWSDGFARLASAPVFLDLAADLAGWESSEEAGISRSAEIAEIFSGSSARKRRRILEIIDTLASRPSHSAWPALALAGLVMETRDSGHDDPAEEDFHVWHAIRHALDEHDAAHLIHVLGEHGGLFGQYAAPYVFDTLPFVIEQILAKDPDIDFAAMPDLPAPLVRSRPPMGEEDFENEAEPDETAPFWLPELVLRRYAGPNAEVPAGAWGRIQDVPADVLAQARAKARDMSGPGMEWMKIVVVAFGPAAGTAVDAVAMTVTKLTNISVDYAAGYVALEYSVHAPWEKGEVTEGAVAAAVVTLLRRDMAVVAEKARASGRKGRVMMDLRGFTNLAIHNAVTRSVGSKAMPEEFEARIGQRLH